MKALFRGVSLILGALLFPVLFSACGSPAVQQPARKEVPVVPEELARRSYIYDELDTGEGTSLYTLRFSEDRYYLYQNEGIGVLKSGSVKAASDKSILLETEEGAISGVYAGSVFEDPSVTLLIGGREMRFTPETDTTEYVYLSYLGVYCGKMDGSDAVLILERWHEWYLYAEGQLARGTYEIYADGRIELAAEGGVSYTGMIDKGSDPFDAKNIVIELPCGVFTWNAPMARYDAAHAMGTYTLSLYPADVFTIHGADGYLKAMGTLRMGEDGGTAVYSPRVITNDTELGEGFDIAFAVSGDTLYFPSSTPLLPRSGNIDRDTGYGSYWSAGTSLEFIRRAEAAKLPSATELFAQDLSSGDNNLPALAGELKAVMPSHGIARPLVLLIDFPDYHRPRHVTAEGLRGALFSLDEPDSLSAYYYRASYGKLMIDGTVLNWYRTKMDCGSYSSDTEIMAEAIEFYIENEGLDLSEYDSDGDGVIDALYVFWAGNMAGSGGMWDSAYRSTWTDSPSSWDRRVEGYIFVPGITVWSSVPPLVCNTNSLLHETGHLLGLNDYYSYDTAPRSEVGEAFTGGALEGGLGGMDMMDTNIGDHNSFSKWLLGWLDPTVIEYGEIPTLDGRTITLRPSAEAPDAIFIKLRDSEDLYTELFVIEVVAPVLNAREYTRLTEPVVRILHVENSPDDPLLRGNWRSFGFRFDNSYTSTKYISILEADGRDEILNFAPDGSASKISYDPADYFLAGDEVTPSTYPNTNAYDKYGNASVPTGLCICIESIDDDGRAVIRLSYEEPAPSLRLTEISPAPQIVPWTMGEQGTVPGDELRFTYDRRLSWAFEGAEDEILVLSDNEPAEGWTAALDGDAVVISKETGSAVSGAYTVVIPTHVLASADDTEVKNDYNGIYGFITE